MSRPIFTTDARSTFGADLVGVAESVARILAEGVAPEPAIVSISEQRTTITPWQPGAPLQGLLLWAEHMTEAEWAAYVHTAATAGSPPVISLYVTGRLDGRPVELIGSTHRVLRSVDPYNTTARQPVSLDEVVALAAAEQPWGAAQ